MDRIAGWWDGFELWIAGLPFIPQVVLVLAVIVPLCWLIAVGLDRGLSAVLSWPVFGWLRRTPRETLREVEEN
ncbi:hypothetical protein [Rhodococcus sp. OK302]|uniref:hypothetical protein n=1 Tax=Rhodococcus sp. OK302 TaxID=1882769 RepID=UPI000B93B178|nr:hypothetical protein [Rhodococcus sp. OK302]OYD71115.1 hypothetical protein BDB13_4768 [Rhodococcus sp. OK302]